MKRHVTDARPNWMQTVESQGFIFHSKGVRPEHGYGTHWCEEVYYEFDEDEVDVIADATKELHALCVKVVEYVSSSPALMQKLGIPPQYHPMIRQSVLQNDPTLYGRFDLSYDGKSPPKMLEYNADTPTTLIEAAIVQWHWQQDKFKDADQFNSLHERLIARWEALADGIDGETVYFGANMEALEEFATVEYLRDTAHQAGIQTAFINMKDIGWNGREFTDLNDNPIKLWFKLYPWEWLATEEFGQHLPLVVPHKLGIMEPVWKMILSNKGILPILWELFPGHPNLLESYWEDDHRAGGFKLQKNFLIKPTLSREGHNIMMVKDAKIVAETQGSYAQSPKIVQAVADLPCFDGNYLVIGSWIIGGDPGGMILREDTSPIIVDRSRVVPHIFR